MEFIRENFEIITIILFIIVFVFLLSILGFNRFFVRYFSNKKFHITTTYQVDAGTQEKQFVISIFNNNINDVRIAGFGYVYQNQNIDFYKSYLIDEELPKDHKIVIPSRDFIFAKINVTTLKTIISDINRGDTSVRSLRVFVTDSLGLTSQSKAKSVRKQLHFHLEKDRMERLMKIKEQKRRVKADEALFKQQKRIERRIHFRETLGKIVLKIKGIFGRKSK